MTNNEAEQFVNKVLRGLWPSWKPTDIFLDLWVSKLGNYDYFRAEQELKNWLCETDYITKTPPINKILKYLNAKKAGIFIEQQDEYIKEPGVLYGREARDKAFADILNGSDNRTRRWLVKYLEKVYPDKDKEGPAHISEAIRL